MQVKGYQARVVMVRDFHSTIIVSENITVSWHMVLNNLSFTMNLKMKTEVVDFFG